VNEGNSGTTSAAFKVTLSGVSPYPVTVDYQTADNTCDFDVEPGEHHHSS
jgi:hypothetical protein